MDSGNIVKYCCGNRLLRDQISRIVDSDADPTEIIDISELPKSNEP